MSKNIFKDRESALEYEFFHRVDDELLARLKAKLDFEQQEHALADATGIKDEAVLAELVELGISSETIFALSLLPLVLVAWADGTIEDREREAILQAAHTAGHERDNASHQLIEEWLNHEPADNIKTAWKDYVNAICNTVSTNTQMMIEKDVLERSRKVAESAGGILGFHKTSDAQQAMLKEIAAAFES